MVNDLFWPKDIQLFFCCHYTDQCLFWQGECRQRAVTFRVRRKLVNWSATANILRHAIEPYLQNLEKLWIMWCTLKIYTKTLLHKVSNWAKEGLELRIQGRRGNESPPSLPYTTGDRYQNPLHILTSWRACPHYYMLDVFKIFSLETESD